MCHRQQGRRQAQIDNGQMSAYEGAVEACNRRNILLKEMRIQSNFYISIATGPEPPMLLEKLCIYRGIILAIVLTKHELAKAMLLDRLC